jgi:uncharacterized protein (TIGR03435 family)
MRTRNAADSRMSCCLLAVGIFGTRSRLGQRIDLLLRRGPTQSVHTSAGDVIVSTVVLCSLLLASSLAPRWIAFAQQAPRLKFEVASLKPSKGGRVMLGIKSPGTFGADNVPLRGLIMEAYGVRAFQVSGGPDWTRSEEFDVIGKPHVDLIDKNQAPEKQLAEMDLMLQSLLEERFRLKIHRETKMLPVYALTPAKGGTKLHPGNCASLEPNGPPPVALPGGSPLYECGSSRWGTNGANRTLVGVGIDMEMLTRWALPTLLGRPVIDKTGYTGKFDAHLEFLPDQSAVGLGSIERAAGVSGAAPAGDSAGPTIFTALQEQLGLKLESDKGPVEVIVIDHVEKPDAN